MQASMIASMASLPPSPGSTAAPSRQGRRAVFVARGADRAPTLAVGAIASSAHKHPLAGAVAKAVGGAAACLVFAGSPMQAMAGVEFLEFQEPPITTSSPKGAVQLAEGLKAGGAKMYGAFWCSHCFNQRQLFGKEAQSNLPYVECYPDGFKRGEPMLEACEAAGIEGFPTWVIGGQKFPGEKPFGVRLPKPNSLQELNQLYGEALSPPADQDFCTSILLETLNPCRSLPS
mmetsp:Transcript_36346/g.114760  ORF Transcript_36346/g.114760 Transcript_36346/m.114760 type:complete len:231 (+) Transcript_36346:157-849(+)